MIRKYRGEFSNLKSRRGKVLSLKRRIRHLGKYYRQTTRCPKDACGHMARLMMGTRLHAGWHFARWWVACQLYQRGTKSKGAST
jgi:hypothetical protein